VKGGRGSQGQHRGNGQRRNRAGGRGRNRKGKVVAERFRGGWGEWVGGLEPMYENGRFEENGHGNRAGGSVRMG